MQRLLGLAIVVLTLTAAGAAVPYDTILYTDDPAEDFAISGEIWSQRLASGEVGVTVTYTLTLTNDAYNRTSLDAFQIGVRNDTTALATTTDALYDIDHGATKDGYIDLTIPTTAEDGKEVFFRINHTAVLPDGDTVTRQVRGDVPYEYEAQNGTIRTIRTNATTVTRGGRLFVNGTTELVRQLTVADQTIDVSGATFAGWLPVPTDSGLGRQNLTYAFETAVGHVIERSISVTVQNAAPTISISHPDSIGQGDPLEIGYTADDEHTNVTVALEDFTGGVPNGTVHNTSQDRFTVPTTGLATGTYAFNITARDGEGGTATASGNISLVRPQDTGTDEDDDGQAETPPTDEQDSQPDSIPIIGAIREFFINLIGALLGFNSGA